MNRLTPVWTDTHNRILLVVAHAALGTALVARGQDLWMSLLVVGLFFLTITVGLAFDWLIALATGLLCAAATYVLRLPVHADGALAFTTSAVDTFFFVTAGFVAQLAGDRTRAMESSGQTDTATLEAPVFGSLGLLHHAIGQMRIEEEIERARRYERPLALARVTLDYPQDAAIDDAQRQAMVRSVARFVEGRARGTDVPFADEQGDILVILTETESDGAWRFMSRVTDAILNATFFHEPSQQTRLVRDFAMPNLSVVEYPHDGVGAAPLMEASRALAQRYRENYAPGKDFSPAIVRADSQVGLSEGAESGTVPAAIQR